MIYDDDVDLLADAIKHSELVPWEASWDIARVVLTELCRRGRLASRLADGLRGDGPCMDCGAEDNIRWFTDNVFWNDVMGGRDAADDPGGILCIPCFVKRADAAGYWPNGWRLLPEWHWQTKWERPSRPSAEETTEATDERDC